MNAQIISNDTARCFGVSFEEYGETHWREGCEACLRRTAPKPERFTMIEPPAIIAFECEHLISPNKKRHEHTK